MSQRKMHRSVRTLVVLMSAVLTACTVPSVPPEPVAPVTVAPEPTHPACVEASANNPVTGNWLTKHKQKGVVGEIRVLFTLQADGSMAYTEQVKRPNKPSQGLNESGCWQASGNTLVLSTQESNGVETEPGDPIYQQNYRILKVAGDKLELRTAEGLVYKLTRMSPGYRLPF